MIGSKLVKRVLKWLGATIGVLVLALSVLAVNAFYFRPFSIRVFFETAFLKIALEDPELLSSMRLLEQAGLTFHNDDLTDISPTQTMRVNGMFEQDLAMLRSYDRASLDGQDALSYDILEWFLQNQAEGIPFTWHSYPVNQMHGEQNGLPNFMANIHHVGGVRDARDYVARLSKFDSKFDQLLEDLRLREEKGILPPRFTVEKVLDEMRGFRGRPARDNVLFTTFVERLDKLDGVDEEERSELERQVETEIERTVYPAYDGLIAYFERLREKATTDHGVWKLPDGDAYYDHMLRRNTTTSLTADQIHELGLSEVARIHAEMDAILAAEGYTEGTIAERMNRLNEEERFLYPNTDDGRRRILEDFRAIIEEIHTGMHAYFGRLPKSPVEVQRVPEFRQAGAAGAYYMSPSMDGARPGVFYANLRDLKEHPRFGMRTLAYHEAVPGHHLQSAIQTELAGVPNFRRVLGFTAFSEGWALYSERLAWEAGYQDDPYDNLGRLQAELFRAVRLVVDTGIHRKRWSREQAIDYMASNTGMAQHDVVSEIERYFVLPGQATAYKVGMMKILELREHARRTLGDRFKLSEFHDVVIGNGDLPLAVLEQEVDRWIDRKRGAAG